MTRAPNALASAIAVVPMPEAPPCTSSVSPALSAPRPNTFLPPLHSVSGTAGAGRDDCAHALALISHVMLPASVRPLSALGSLSSIADCRSDRPILRWSGAKGGKRFGASAERAEIGIAAGLHEVAKNGLG